ncbi:MAG: helix-turn-helix domain-containing protein [Alphaproteobacteria bacterium]|nr:helix-turn-helix domain-containing protein [Alphaproteobacteria bacterium]
MSVAFEHSVSPPFPGEDPAPRGGNDVPIGLILRQTRQHYGQSLIYIESILRIRASQLDAIERGDLEKLPGRVYAIGFVRVYAEYLGLPPDDVVRLFKEQYNADRTSRPELSFPVPASESKIPNLFVLVGSLAGLVLLIGGVALLNGSATQARTVQEIPPVPLSWQAQSHLHENWTMDGKMPLEAAAFAAIETAAREERPYPATDKH